MKLGLGTFTLSAATALLLCAMPASAQVAASGAAMLAKAPASAIDNVQYYRHGYYGPRHYGRGYYGRGYGGAGAAAAAGVAGLAAGALIAGAIANQNRAPSVTVIEDPAWEARCARRFRSFDPVSGTYLGRDGVRRHCE